MLILLLLTYVEAFVFCWIGVVFGFDCWSGGMFVWDGWFDVTVGELVCLICVWVVSMTCGVIVDVDISFGVVIGLFISCCIVMVLVCINEDVDIIGIREMFEVWFGEIWWVIVVEEGDNGNVFCIVCIVVGVGVDEGRIGMFGVIIFGGRFFDICGWIIVLTLEFGIKGIMFIGNFVIRWWLFGGIWFLWIILIGWFGVGNLFWVILGGYVVVIVGDINIWVRGVLEFDIVGWRLNCWNCWIVIVLRLIEFLGNCFIVGILVGLIVIFSVGIIRGGGGLYIIVVVLVRLNWEKFFFFRELLVLFFGILFVFVFFVSFFLYFFGMIFVKYILFEFFFFFLFEFWILFDLLIFLV